MNVEIIVGIPLLIKAIILGIQNILEVLLEDLEICLRENQRNIVIRQIVNRSSVQNKTSRTAQ